MAALIFLGLAEDVTPADFSKPPNMEVAKAIAKALAERHDSLFKTISSRYEEFRRSLIKKVFTRSEARELRPWTIDRRP